ncbi:hypothetical protein DFH09DRAFT_1325322 [Mycena vulgaris]|nr:hypothetical protein DFH09DRAFT_1325322 [Mycena vulgaris]
MSEREGTGSKSTGRRLKASTASKRTITDSDYEEPGPPPKRRKAADNPNLAIEEVQAETVHNTLGHFRNRNIHEGVATRFEEVAGQVGSLGTRLPQVLAALNAGTAVGDQADLGQPILQEITMFGGNGGNGGNGFDRGIGGDGGVGEGPRLQIENFSGTQIIIRYMEGGGQVNPGIGRIGEGLANIRDGVAEVGGQMRSLINDLLRRFKTQLMAHIPRGVSDDLFHVMDPVGGPIAVSLRYCHDYATLDDILKGYLRRLPRAGGRYVERGDYGIVSENGSFMEPVKFAQTVKAGMLLEISILQRQLFTGNHDRKRVVQVYHLREKLSDG